MDCMSWVSEQHARGGEHQLALRCSLFFFKLMCYFRHHYIIYLSPPTEESTVQYVYLPFSVEWNKRVMRHVKFSSLLFPWAQRKSKSNLKYIFGVRGRKDDHYAYRRLYSPVSCSPACIMQLFKVFNPDYVQFVTPDLVHQHVERLHNALPVFCIILLLSQICRVICADLSLNPCDFFFCRISPTKCQCFNRPWHWFLPWAQWQHCTSAQAQSKVRFCHLKRWRSR